MPTIGRHLRRTSLRGTTGSTYLWCVSIWPQVRSQPNKFFKSGANFSATLTVYQDLIYCQLAVYATAKRPACKFSGYLCTDFSVHGCIIVDIILSVKFMARLEGFEPPADGLEIRCSIQLSYSRITLLCSYTL